MGGTKRAVAAASPGEASVAPNAKRVRGTGGGSSGESISVRTSSATGASTGGNDGKALTLAGYRERLRVQGKYEDTKPGSRSRDGCLQDPPAMPPIVKVQAARASEPQRGPDGCFVFKDFPDFRPNLSPQQVMQQGSFGGTYFRDIVSAVTGQQYRGREVIKEFPASWFKGLDLDEQVISPTYRKMVNRHKVSCGGSLGMWETSGWISAEDPYGWFQWYCRFFLGRRCSDDERQVDRWLKGEGPKGRWRVQLMNKILNVGAKYSDEKVSPVMRQVLQHWAYELTAADLEAHRAAKIAKG